MHFPFPSSPAFFASLALLIATAAQAEPHSKTEGAVAAAKIADLPTPALAPRIGQPLDDREIVRFLEAEARKLLAAGQFAKLRFDRHSCAFALPPPAHDRLSLPKIAAQAEAATVVFGEFFQNPKGRKIEFSTAAGGFFVSESGICVTCLHVVTEKGSKGLVAMTRDGRVFGVREVLASDSADDVVVLQLDCPPEAKLPILTLAAEPAPIGSAIAIMSHPDERFYMLTTGVVARHAIWNEKGAEEHFMTVTADFAKGSSGCPVLDENGAVIGLVNNTESIYYDDDGRKKQLDLQMVVKNATPSWVVRRLFLAP